MVFTVLSPQQSFEQLLSEALSCKDHPLLLYMDGKHFGQGRQGHSPGIPIQMLRVAMDCIFAVGDNNDALYFKGENLLLLTDGRNQKAAASIKKEISSRVKLVSSTICKRKGTLELRFLHHLREFGTNGHMKMKSKKVLHAQLAEPLENGWVVRGKTCVVPIVERRFIDLPGDSSNRSLCNL